MKTILLGVVILRILFLFTMHTHTDYIFYTCNFSNGGQIEGYLFIHFPPFN